jgi:four helix bundle protein
VIARQVTRSGTSVGAQYRESARAKSNADFISKLEGALQELEETKYWLELLGDIQPVVADQIRPLYQEVDELTRIFVTIVLTGLLQNGARSQGKANRRLMSGRLMPSRVRSTTQERVLARVSRAMRRQDSPMVVRRM